MDTKGLPANYLVLTKELLSHSGKLALAAVEDSNLLTSISAWRRMSGENWEGGFEMEQNVSRVEFIQLALEHKPLNLGQGLPDDLVPDYVVDALREVVMDQSMGVALHQYTRGFGHPRLVSAIAALYSKLLGINHSINPTTEVLVTDGAYEALFTAILGHVNPGDEVIIIEPYFDCYEPMVKLAGGTPVFISLKPVSKTNSWKLISCYFAFY